MGEVIKLCKAPELWLIRISRVLVYWKTKSHEIICIKGCRWRDIAMFPVHLQRDPEGVVVSSRQWGCRVSDDWHPHRGGPHKPSVHATVLLSTVRPSAAESCIPVTSNQEIMLWQPAANYRRLFESNKCVSSFRLHKQCCQDGSQLQSFPSAYVSQHDAVSLAARITWWQ